MPLAGLQDPPELGVRDCHANLHRSAVVLRLKDGNSGLIWVWSGTQKQYLNLKSKLIGVDDFNKGT